MRTLAPSAPSNHGLRIADEARQENIQPNALDAIARATNWNYGRYVWTSSGPASARHRSRQFYTISRMILDRRGFLSAVPALLAPGAVSGAEAERKTRFYVLEQYQLEQGPQTSRIHDFFSKALLPALDRVHRGPKIFLEAVAAPHLPTVTAIFGVESVGQIWEISQQLFADKDFSRAFDQWESGEEPFVTSSASLLETTAYSPEIVPPEKAPESPAHFRVAHVSFAHRAAAQGARRSLQRSGNQNLPPLRHSPGVL